MSLIEEITKIQQQREALQRGDYCAYFFPNQSPSKQKYLYEQKWLIFMEPYAPFMCRRDQADYLVSDLKNLTWAIWYHTAMRDKLDGNCAYEAAEWHQQKINESEWLMFQWCN